MKVKIEFKHHPEDNDSYSFVYVSSHPDLNSVIVNLIVASSTHRMFPLVDGSVRLLSKEFFLGFDCIELTKVEEQ